MEEIPMAQPGSVAAWIRELTGGNRDAAEQLWQHYFHRLVRLAYAELRNISRRAVNEEDVALSAFASFCRGAENGRFSQLRDRNNLWPLLIVITKRKAIALRRHVHSLKEGGGKVRGESAFRCAQGSDASVPGIQRVVDPEPTPELAAQLAEEHQRLLDLLGDETLRQIAIWKMEGYTDKEVAAKLNCGLRNVERKLQRIRSILKKEISDE
jgi:DNA-directed RNA polymerase specialized sigma24 family protein